MKRAYLFLLCFVLLISACAPSSPNCKKGICVRLIVGDSIMLNNPVGLSVVVTADNDAPGLKLGVTSSSPDVITGTHTWTVDAKAQVPVEFNTSLKFTKVGYYLIVGGAVTKEGMNVDDSMYIEVSATGSKIYLQGTPLPITPFVINSPAPLLNSKGTPIATPTKAGTPPGSSIPTPTRAAYP